VIRKRIILDPITTSADLTTAALSYSTSLSKDFKLLSVHFHASTNITETVKVIKDMNAGANYDSELASSDLAAADDYVFRPDGDEIFKKGDEVKVTCTKANTTGSIYVSIYVEEI